MCKFSLMGCLQIICKIFFAKPVQSVFLCHRLSKKLKFIKIWQIKVGQNKYLVCYRKKQGGLWVFRKSQKIWTASDQHFLSYVKKNYRGGGKLPPPPSRNRVKMPLFWVSLYIFSFCTFCKPTLMTHIDQHIISIIQGVPRNMTIAVNSFEWLKTFCSLFR